MSLVFETRTLILNVYLFYFHLMMRAAYVFLYKQSTMCNWTNKSIRTQTDVYKDVNKEPNAELWVFLNDTAADVEHVTASLMSKSTRL